MIAVQTHTGTGSKTTRGEALGFWESGRTDLLFLRPLQGFLPPGLCQHPQGPSGTAVSKQGGVARDTHLSGDLEQKDSETPEGEAVKASCHPEVLKSLTNKEGVLAQ